MKVVIKKSLLSVLMRALAVLLFITVPVFASPPTPIKELILGHQFNDIALGMHEDDIKQKLNGYVSDDPELEQPDCYYLIPIDDTKQSAIYFMIYEQALNRIDISDKSISTLKNIGIDSSSAEALYAYPNATTQPHPYLGNVGSYIMASDINNTDIIFEMYEDKVVGFWVGTGSAMELIEGCS